jgi:hypothetical protein
VALAAPASATVTVGTKITAFPNRDMVVAVGYQPDEELTVDVLRGDVVIGTTTGRALETPEGTGLEINHGVEGTPQPDEGWTDYTPDIIGGDVIRVTTPRGVDTTTVADVDFTGEPVVLEKVDVAVNGRATAPGGAQLPADEIVEFRRDDLDPRLRRGGPDEGIRTSCPDAASREWQAVFAPTTVEEGYRPARQRELAVAGAWAAAVGRRGRRGHDRRARRARRRRRGLHRLRRPGRARRGLHRARQHRKRRHHALRHGP